LEERGVYNREVYYPKGCEEFKDVEFDLVVTVCDSVKEECSISSFKTKESIHMGFEDPDGKDYREFENSFLILERDSSLRLRRFYNTNK